MTWRNKLPTLTALLHDRTLRVAVTGLSQSGKTAFITSLVHNLVGTVGRPGRLPFLRAAAERRILAARVLASDDNTVGRFPLEQNVSALAELRIEIVDYPGEWLLDLPLLRQSYAE